MVGVGGNEGRSDHLDDTEFCCCTSQIEFAIGMTQFSQRSRTLKYVVNGLLADIRRTTRNVNRHFAQVSQYCRRPINLSNIAQDPRSEPYPSVQRTLTTRNSDEPEGRRQQRTYDMQRDSPDL
jgi:hypothetical protein